MKLAVGIDLGGTTARAALVDENGNIIKDARALLSDYTPAAVITQLIGLIKGLDSKGLSYPAAMGIAAQLWVKTGIVAVSPNLGWKDVAFGDMLKEAFGQQIRLVNDLDAITVGEARCGAGRGEQDVLCMFLGTGVGMGAICQGLLLEGADGLATELGHIKVASPKTGRACGCGERGCVEAYSSGRHLPELLAEKVKSGLLSPLFDSVAGDLSKLNAVNIEAACIYGDKAADALWNDIAEKLGLATANAITILNPRVAILGGGVLVLAPTLRQRIVQVIKDNTARPALSKLEIRDTELGDKAGLVGAGLLAQPSN
ncbi:MAG: ROK family protein [Deltaproteobacteria bacterium]|nr:ROK family protein [Deltaproteobacteria bacterium]